jgi:excisionase family DNA binding protein
MEATETKLLTAAELARRLDVGQDKVRVLAREGRIPSLTVGTNGLRFDWHEVLRALRTEAATTRQERTA